MALDLSHPFMETEAGSCGLPGEAADAATTLLNELDVESVTSSLTRLLRGFPPDVKHHSCQLLRAARLRFFRPDLLHPEVCFVAASPSHPSGRLGATLCMGLCPHERSSHEGGSGRPMKPAPCASGSIPRQTVPLSTDPGAAVHPHLRWSCGHSAAQAGGDPFACKPISYSVDGAPACNMPLRVTGGCHFGLGCRHRCGGFAGRPEWSTTRKPLKANYPFVALCMHTFVEEALGPAIHQGDVGCCRQLWSMTLGKW